MRINHVLYDSLFWGNNIPLGRYWNDCTRRKPLNNEGDERGNYGVSCRSVDVVLVP